FCYRFGKCNSLDISHSKPTLTLKTALIPFATFLTIHYITTLQPIQSHTTFHTQNSNSHSKLLTTLLMKKIILSSLFCFVSFALCAQPVWHAEIPCDSYCSAFQKRGLIKTLDDNYLVGLNESTQYQSRIYLVKYDQEGNLTWKKPYDFGATTPSPPYTAGPFLSRFIEDANGDILCVGTIIDGSKIPPHQSFFFRTDSEGDSLHLNIDSTYSGYSNLFLLNEEGEYFALRGNG